MKALVFPALFGLLALSGCSFVKLNKLVENQKITLKDEPISFSVVGNRILLGDGVDFYLDIGAPNLLYPDRMEGLKIVDSIKIGELEAANGKKLENKSYVFERIENKFFRVDQAVFRVFGKESNCDNQRGLVGCELFTDQILKIDFAKHQLSRLGQATLAQATQGYTMAKTVDFDGYYFQIEILIDGKPIVAKLDTGNKYDLLLKKEDYDKIRNGQYLSYFKTAGTLDTLYNSKNVASVGHQSDNPIVVKSNKYIKRNLIGTGYMKNYNWIIDFKNGEVYYQKIHDNVVKILPHRAVIKDEDVVFYQTDEQSKIAALGSKITRIDNKTVTDQNRCEVTDLLNATPDWDAFHLEYSR